jgi:predicted  nucleic acid-binding Zn-ribbon protein
MALFLINLISNLTGSKRSRSDDMAEEQYFKIQKVGDETIIIKEVINPILAEDQSDELKKKNDEIIALQKQVEEMRNHIAGYKTTIITSGSEKLRTELEKVKNEKKEITNLLHYVSEEHKELISRIKACKKRDTVAGLRLDENSINIESYNYE